MRKIITGTALLLLAATSLAEQQSSPSEDAADRNYPPSVYISKDACPFECCTYREWLAASNVELHDRPLGRVTATIKKSDHVQAITGVVITHPLPSVTDLLVSFPERS